MTGEVLPGRECGACNVCCVALTIRDPELEKLQGYRCKHAQRDSSCAIYPSRPRTCREFECGWRVLRWVPTTLRPDLSGVLVRLHRRFSATEQKEQLGIAVTLLNRRALKAEGLAEAIAAAVNADVPVYLHIPGPPGHTSAQALINDVVAHAVRTRDRPALLELLRRARDRGLAGKFQPIPLQRTADHAPKAL